MKICLSCNENSRTKRNVQYIPFDSLQKLKCQNSLQHNYSSPPAIKDKKSPLKKAI